MVLGLNKTMPTYLSEHVPVPNIRNLPNSFMYWDVFHRRPTIRRLLVLSEDVLVYVLPKSKHQL